MRGRYKYEVLNALIARFAGWNKAPLSQEYMEKLWWFMHDEKGCTTVERVYLGIAGC